MVKWHPVTQPFDTQTGKSRQVFFCDSGSSHGLLRLEENFDLSLKLEENVPSLKLRANAPKEHWKRTTVKEIKTVKKKPNEKESIIELMWTKTKIRAFAPKRTFIWTQPTIGIFEGDFSTLMAVSFKGGYRDLRKVKYVWENNPPWYCWWLKSG